MKKELIEKIMSLTHPTQDIAYVGKGFLQQILSEELPDFQRIDEERFKRIYASKVCDIGLHIKEYNSTLQPALKPLPKEMPKDILDKWMNEATCDFDSIWEELFSRYGTPEPKPREWWQDCEKFMHKGIAYKKYSHQVYPDGRTFLHSELSRHDLQDCTPYTHPTADDIIAKHNLTEEEVKAIREGKDGK